MGDKSAHQDGRKKPGFNKRTQKGSPSTMLDRVYLLPEERPLDGFWNRVLSFTLMHQRFGMTGETALRSRLQGDLGNFRPALAIGGAQGGDPHQHVGGLGPVMHRYAVVPRPQ